MGVGVDVDEEQLDVDEEENEGEEVEEEDTAEGDILHENDSDDENTDNSEEIHVLEVVGDSIPIPQHPTINRASPLDATKGWNLQDIDPGPPNMDPFTARPGLYCEKDEISTPRKIFGVMFDDAMFETMATETNRFANRKKATQEEGMLSI